MNRTVAWLGIIVAAAAGLVGCNSDSFMNPAVTGYWEDTPVTIPILERIDVIEKESDYWGQTTGVTPEDLIPGDLAYRTVPGDFVTVSIYELFAPGQWSNTTRRIDAAGFLRLPELGDIQAAGRTPQEIQDVIEEILRLGYIARPQVDVVVEEGSEFNYTVYGAVPGPGLYNLRSPDFRLVDALAVAGGVSQVIKSIYIIRQVELSEDVKPSFERGRAPDLPAPPPTSDETLDIEELIDELQDVNDVRPGAFASQDEPIIDIQDLEPARVNEPPVVDIDDLRRTDRPGGSWVYVEERGEWVRVSPEAVATLPVTTPAGERPLYAERIIKIPYQRLSRGDSSYNVVIRPQDRIFVDPPTVGVVYIDGQINRPGTFNIPPRGTTLSRLVAAAGGLDQIAIPSRVDLVRMVGDNREAAVRLNLGAIRNRTEPDLWLKPDDHIIIGTNFVATPLAVIRNGFRVTYGFGFLLDRNFGNDVFGPPPSSNFRN